jgi:hypothetical protein
MRVTEDRLGRLRARVHKHQHRQAEPMPDGINEMPMIKIVNGIQTGADEG